MAFVAIELFDGLRLLLYDCRGTINRRLGSEPGIGREATPTSTVTYGRADVTYDAACMSPNKLHYFAPLDAPSAVDAGAPS